MFFLCQIWALYLQQVLNDVPMNKDPHPNFKLCTATLSCRNLITVHFWTYISKKIWCGWSFVVQSYLKGLWHASAHVRHLYLWSGEPFFKIGFWWANPLPSTLRCSRKLLYQYSRDILSIMEVLNAIFCIFVQALSKKFEVIKDKCMKAYYLLSVFLQTDQMWRLMWSSGFQPFVYSKICSPATGLPSRKTPK